MANIKIELGHPVIDGMPLSFRAPCNCNEVTGIKVMWPDGEDIHFIVFSFADAHKNDLTGLGNLFAANAMVRVVLDTANAKAYLQNADTNAYLEAALAGKLPAIESTEHPGCYYRMVDGEQEWLNPPVEDNVEYKTTERYRGKPIYTRAVNCGTVPNAGSSKTVSIDGSISRVIRAWSTAYGAEAFVNSAYDDELKVKVTSTQIDVVASADFVKPGTVVTMVCQIWYIK